MSTILKWAGNKTTIMSELKKHLPAGPRLVEPFAGSCAVMMETDYCPSAHSRPGARLLWDRSMSTLSALLRPRLNSAPDQNG